MNKQRSQKGRELMEKILELEAKNDPKYHPEVHRMALEVEEADGIYPELHAFNFKKPSL